MLIPSGITGSFTSHDRKRKKAGWLLIKLSGDKSDAIRYGFIGDENTFPPGGPVHVERTGGPRGVGSDQRMDHR